MDLPDIGRYRRRFIVEFGPEDSGLIDRMGVAHRTKRAAIIAGLRLLESGELERLRTQVVELEARLATAKTSATPKPSMTGTAKLDKARADLAAERKAHGRTQKALDNAETAVTDTKAALAQAKTEAGNLRAERDRLAALLPYAAYCGSCDKLVPAAEWAEHATPTGIDVYHQPDGYRAKGSLISGSATVVLQRHAPGQGTR